MAANHCCDVIVGTMASQITSLTIVYWTVYSGVDQIKHQSSASLAFVRGIHLWPVNSPLKGPVTRKCFHLMTSSWTFHDDDNGETWVKFGFHKGYTILQPLPYSCIIQCRVTIYRVVATAMIGHIITRHIKDLISSYSYFLWPQHRQWSNQMLSYKCTRIYM